MVDEIQNSWAVVYGFFGKPKYVGKIIQELQDGVKVRRYENPASKQLLTHTDQDINHEHIDRYQTIMQACDQLLSKKRDITKEYLVSLLIENFPSEKDNLAALLK